MDAIIAAAQEAAHRPVPSLASHAETNALTFERIQAKAPERLRLDPAGFFIMLPDPNTGIIVCEHYENNGRHAAVIEGRQAALVAATAVERGLVSRLDHAAYLGRELAKAELCFRTDIPRLETLDTPRLGVGTLPGDYSSAGRNVGDFVVLH